MTEMTPKERVVKLFNKEPIDIMPVFSGQGMVLIQAIQEMGIRFPQVHTSAEYLAGSAIKTAEMFGFDALIIPYDMCTIPWPLNTGMISIGSLLNSFTTLSLGVIAFIVYSL